MVRTKPRARGGGIGARTKSEYPQKTVWAMRRRGWIEFRTHSKRPIKRISRIDAGGTRLVAHSMRTGVFLGIAQRGYPIGGKYHFYTNYLREGQVVLVPEEFRESLLSEHVFED